MAKTVRSVVSAVNVLRDRGVSFAFGVPGESFLGLLDALHDTPEIQLISTRHEGGAAFMADAAAKLTGQPAICMGTRGVGSANLAIGIHTAQQDSTPMIAMVGQVETPFRHREALQEVELSQFLGPITKWAVEAPSAQSLPRLAAEAYRLSTTGRPGPVAIALRSDILDEYVDEEVFPQTAIPAAQPPLTAIRQALELLESAEQPLIIAGGGVLRSHGVAELVAFAEAISCPVISAFRRLDAFPTDHPLSLGSLSFGTPAPVRRRAVEADVVLAIGTRLSELTTLGYTVPGPGAQLIHVDISPDELGRSYPASVAIAADAATAIRSFNVNAGGYDWPTTQQRNQDDRTAYMDAVEASAGGVDELVDPAIVVKAMAKWLPDNAVTTADAGNFFGWVQRFGSFRKPGTFLGPTSGAMGYAVPAAVAATIVHQGKVPVVATAGDGGFFMTGNELAVAAQLGLPLICVVFNNALYGTIRLHQEREYPGRVAGTELWTPDITKYTEAFGGRGIRVEHNSDAEDAIRDAIAHGGITVIDVTVSRETIAPGVKLSEVASKRQ
ncbi:thiamine pyrophosphate-binding protein [soil metagenome]